MLTSVVWLVAHDILLHEIFATLKFRGKKREIKVARGSLLERRHPFLNQILGK